MKTNEIKEKLGDVVAIEHTLGWGFEPLSYIASEYFKDLGIETIFFKHSFKNASWRKSNTKKFQAPQKIVKLYWIGLSLTWGIRYYINALLVQQNIFNFQGKAGIKIGDLIISQTVSSSTNYPSTLLLDRHFFRNLVKAYGLSLYAEWLLKQKTIKTFLLCDNVYFYAIYNRMALQRKESYLQLGRFPFSVLVNKKTTEDSPFILPIHQFPGLSHLEESATETYMQERVKPASQALPYMTASMVDVNKSTDEELFLINFPKNIRDITTGEINICIFLHSFADALFFFGDDCFLDIWEWTKFTIDQLLLATEKKQDIKILIKPHPNVFARKDYQCKTLEKDYETLKKLHQYYFEKSSVSFISPFIPNIELSSLKNFIGVTHHGNIATELAFLGKPAIASRQAPWKYSPEFLVTWDTKEEYKQILFRLRSVLDFSISRPKLLKFAFYYHLSFNHISKGRHYGDSLFKIVYGKLPDNDREFQLKSTQITDYFMKNESKREEAKLFFEQLLLEALEYNRRIYSEE